MAKVFLDTNIFIDIVESRREISRKDFVQQSLFISPLSIHILAYTYKYQIPEEKLFGFERYYTIVSFDEDITQKALNGPTRDFEDNVQLHSAASAQCDVFLTADEKLLKMKFFGETKISSAI